MSYFDVLPPLERENLPCLVRSRDLESQLLEDPADLRYLFRVARSEFPTTDVKRVLETHTDVTAEHCRLGDQRHLVPPRGQHRLDVVFAEEAVGGAAHEDHVIRIGSDAAEDAENALDPKRRLRKTLVEEVSQIV